MKPYEFREISEIKARLSDPNNPYHDPNFSHRDYVNEVEKIANAIYPDICFSTGQRLEGIGLIGIIAEIALFSNSGSILEIGIGTSSMYLTALAQRYGRAIYHNDIEITKILCCIGTKRHIAPDSNIFFCTSDEMFKNNKLPSLAFAFIDGCHEYEQAKRDFWNTVPYMVDNGFILLHDTYPRGEDEIGNNLCWDCYRLRQDLEKDKRFDCLSFPLRGQIGFTLVRKKPLILPYYQA